MQTFQQAQREVKLFGKKRLWLWNMISIHRAIARFAPPSRCQLGGGLLSLTKSPRVLRSYIGCIIAHMFYWSPGWKTAGLARRQRRLPTLRLLYDRFKPVCTRTGAEPGVGAVVAIIGLPARCRGRVQSRLFWTQAGMIRTAMQAPGLRRGHATTGKYSADLLPPHRRFFRVWILCCAVVG